MSLKTPGNLLYLVGSTRNELAGSHYAEIQPLPDDSRQQTSVPKVDVPHARALMGALGSAIRQGIVQACHDLSEGGLAIAAAEMSLAGLLGMTIDVGNVLPDMGDASDIIALFSELPTRFLVEIAPEQQAAFEAHMRERGIQDISHIGTVTAAQQFIVTSGEQALIDLPVAALQMAWKGEQA